MKFENQSDVIWDYVIIGTGMGGGPIGLKLAQAGFSVLFLERGSSPSDDSALKGNYAELFPGNKKEMYRRAGRFSDFIYDKSQGSVKFITPFMGSGVGGSSALYGGVLERFKAKDFEKWPLSYTEFIKYYEQAETLFRVRKAKTFTHPENQLLAKYFQTQGLHPYCLPIANENRDACDGCQSFLCNQQCKIDSRRACIETAIKDYAAQLYTNCEVLKLQISDAKAIAAYVRFQDKNLEIKAHHFILAAGALNSPLILQKSGLKHPSDLIGRYLMRHYVDLYALKVDSKPDNLYSKEIGLDDFYDDGGTLQSFGPLPPVSVILKQIKSDMKKNTGKFEELFFKLFRPFISIILNVVTSRRLVLASILEDQPQFENRVWIEENNIHLFYKISKADKKTITSMRKKIKKYLRPFNKMIIKNTENNSALAHICGTCRMGLDPATSVVDTDNKIHGMKNLFVVDSSFFPTSGRTNPALTVAANSLRVADLIIQSQRKSLAHDK